MRIGGWLIERMGSSDWHGLWGPGYSFESGDPKAHFMFREVHLPFGFFLAESEGELPVGLALRENPGSRVGVAKRTVQSLRVERS